MLTSVSGRHNLLALFEDQSRCHGSCEAVRQGAKCLTYDELNRSANTVVHREAVEQWIDLLLTRQYPPGRETSDAIFALSQLARYSSDRAATCPTRFATKCWPASNSSAPTRPSSAPSANTTSSKPPRRASPWATPCRSACGCVKRINNPPPCFAHPPD